MTIAPTATTPAVPNALPGATGDGAAVAGTPGAATVPGDFLALVQQALTAALGGTPTGTPTLGSPATKTAAAGAPAGSTAGTPASATDGAPGPDAGAATAADTALVAAANGLPGLVAPVPSAPVAVAATTSTAVSAAADGQVATAGATAARPAGAGPASPLPTGPHTAAEGKASSAAAGDGAPSAPTVATALPSATHPGGGEAGPSADAGAGQQPSPAAPTAVPTHAPAPAVATAPSATPAAAPVTGQVFPEVTSLASRGDGTHRITLTLKPEALGEVRVVMTVRDGAVHVRLAAGHEAQQALLSGTSELSRLLEHAGATDTRIVVRDLGGATAPTTGTSNDRGADLGQSSGFGLGAGDHRSTDQHAGTRAEHHATDGGHDTTTAGTTASRPVQPATRTRTAGVDVTM
jgi:hypothetical protein